MKTRLAILSRNRNLHSIRRLLQESKRAGFDTDVINPLDCQIVIDGERSCLLHGNQRITRGSYDFVLPRIGASITEYGIAVVNQFESLGIRAINSSRAIAESRDKLRSLQILTQAGLQVPPTAMSRNLRGLRSLVDAVRGLPVVVKVLRGTQGVGVMLLNAPISLKSVLETLRGLEQDVILQRFISEGAGRDYRVFVVGGKVMAVMMRTAASGDFRSNIHQGGKGSLVTLPPAFSRTAIAAAKALGVEVAGVDLMESANGPIVLEVNSSPGFEGIEAATGLNVAGTIVDYLKKVTPKKAKASRARLRAGARPRRR